LVAYPFEEAGMFERRTGMWVLMAMAALACGRGPEAADPPQTLAGEPRVPPTEGELLGILRAANEGEVTLGRWILEREAREEVRSYATKMVTEHTAANERLTQEATRLGSRIEESAFSRALEEDVRLTQLTLQATPTRGVGLTYLDSQLAAHAKVAQMLDANLGRSPGWIPELTAHREAVQRHLEEAAELQRKLQTEATPR
jgi:putative membrane protein